MKHFKNTIKYSILVLTLLLAVSCNDLLNEPAENKSFTEETDYTISSNMSSAFIENKQEH